MTHMILPRGVGRDQIRVFCPQCGRQLPLVVTKIETTGGVKDRFDLPDHCSDCGARIREGTAQPSFTIAERIELCEATIRKTYV